MTSAIVAPGAGQRKRWLSWILVILGAHLGLLFWLSAKPRLARAPAEPQIQVRLALPRSGSEEAGATLPQLDPTLFALVSERGFSRSAWLAIKPRNYLVTNALPAPEYLPVEGDELAGDLAEFVQTNLLGHEVPLDHLKPAFTRLDLPKPKAVSATWIRTEGGLEGRDLLPDQALPRLAEPVLTNSIVQVAVTSGGRTLSAVLVSNGVPSADAQALAFARRARFVPLHRAGLAGANSGGLTFGNLVFQWWQMRTGATQSVAAKP